MAAEADQRGYEYIAVTDHAKGPKIAGGVDEKQLQRQAREIAAVNNKMEKSGKRVHVLRSIELNLNFHGEGNMNARALTRLDIVLGCFHSSLRRKEDQTDRCIAALSNPIDPDTRSSAG
jgi:histidinol phosphatase-like PHP family hydrolase